MEALRQLVASFTVEVDRAGALKRGNADVNALKANLQSLEAGAKAAAGGVSGAFSRLGAGLKSALGGGLGGFGSAVNASSQGIQRGIGGAIGAIATLQNGIAALGVGVIGSQLKSLIDGIGDIEDVATRLGVTNAEVQRLTLLAKFAGTSVQALGGAFRVLGAAAADPSKETAEAFAKVGVSVRDAGGELKSRQDLFFETAGALADISNESERAALAQQLFGQSAIGLLPLLSQGSEGLRAQRAELEKLPVLSDSLIAKSGAFGDQWDIMTLKLKAAAGPVLEKLVIPAFGFLIDVVNLLSDAVGKFVKWFNPLTAGFAALVVALSPLVSTFGALIALGGGWTALARTVVTSIGRMMVALAPAVAAFLVLEDLFVFFAGGKSLIGRGLEKAFGPGITKAVTDLRDAVKDLWGWITGEKADIGKFKSLIDEIGLALRLMIHNTLVALGLRSGDAGLSGLEQYESPEAQARRAGPTTIPNARGGETAMVFNPATGGFMAVPNTIPAPGGASGAGAPAAGTVIQANGDRVVNVTMAPGSSPSAVAGAVSRALERDRSSDLANVK